MIDVAKVRRYIYRVYDVKPEIRIMKTDIVLSGVGGQGILSIATLLGAAALDE